MSDNLQRYIIERLDDLIAQGGGAGSTDLADIKTAVEATKLTNDTIAGDTTSMDAKLTDIDTVLDAIAVDTGSMDGKLTTIDSSLSTIDTSIGTVNTNLTTINSTLTTMDGVLDAIEVDTGVIAGDTTSMDGKLTTIDAVLDNIKLDTASIGNIYSDTTAIKNDIATMQTDLDLIKDDIDDINAEIEEELGGDLITAYGSFNSSGTIHNVANTRVRALLLSTVGAIHFRIFDGSGDTLAYISFPDAENIYIDFKQYHCGPSSTVSVQVMSGSSTVYYTLYYTTQA